MTTPVVLLTALDNIKELTIAFLRNTTPVAEPDDKAMSASVDTVMPVGLPAVAAPIVRPERVMVKSVAAGMPASLVEMKICVAVGADENAVINATEAVPAALFAGVAVVAKKPGG
jgi:hypothetical protein